MVLTSRTVALSCRLAAICGDILVMAVTWKSTKSQIEHLPQSDGAPALSTILLRDGMELFQICSGRTMTDFCTLQQEACCSGEWKNRGFDKVVSNLYLSCRVMVAANIAQLTVDLASVST